MGHGLGVLPGDADRLIGPAGVVDALERVARLAAARDAEGRFAGDDVEGLQDLHGVAGERHPYLDALVEGGDHRLVAGAHGRLDELLHVLEHAVAVEGVEGEVVDVEDQAAALALGDVGDGLGARLGGSGGAGSGYFPLLGLDLVEVRDRLRHAVLVEDEVVLGQPVDPLPLLVGDDDVDVDDADVDLVDVRRRIGLLVRRLLGEDGQRCREYDEKGRCFPHVDRVLSPQC
jgi:hypothetical protein